MDNWQDFDYKFSIKSSASLVEGPSAGAAMALMIITQLEDRPLPEYVSVTGTVDEDGTIGTVGGVFEKAIAASEQGIKLFLIPKGEARRIEKLDEGVKSINLVQYMPAKYGIKVVEVETIQEVLAFY